MLTEVATSTGNNDIINNADELYDQIDDFEIVPKPAYDFGVVEENKLRRREQAKRRWTVNFIFWRKSLMATLSKVKLALLLTLVSFSLDARCRKGSSGPYILVWTRSVPPNPRRLGRRQKFRAEKLFVSVDRSNATFKEVISLWKQLNELTA